jgi:ATPase subunit of ABC transporter with duplicated ATPase domains
MSNPVISLSSVSFAWSDGTPVFSELDLLVPAGRCGLVGINGAGKSTLLRLIGGELAPESGHILVSGRVGYLPQDLMFDPDARVAEFVASPRSWRRSARSLVVPLTRRISMSSVTTGTSSTGRSPRCPGWGSRPTS